ncbi:hypothetical protein [Staphylococcus aureus]
MASIGNTNIHVILRINEY